MNIAEVDAAMAELEAIRSEAEFDALMDRIGLGEEVRLHLVGMVGTPDRYAGVVFGMALATLIQGHRDAS